MQHVKLPVLLLVFLAYTVYLVKGQKAGCECQAGSTGCAANCSCLRGNNFYPYYPTRNECRLSDNSSISALGDIIQPTSGAFLFQTAMTASILSTPSLNNDLMVTVWHATNGVRDQVLGSIFSSNGTLVSGSEPFAISDLIRIDNPNISKKITVIGSSTVFIVIWIEGISGTDTVNPIKARCFYYDGSALGPVQTLTNTNNLVMDVDLTSYSAKLSDVNVLALYWGSKGDRKISLNFYDINYVTGVITSQGPASQVHTLSIIYNRDIRPDFLQIYRSDTTTSILMLVEDMSAENANSTLNVVIWSGDKTVLYSFQALSTARRLHPGATAAVIDDKFVVLWNEPGNLEFSSIKGRVFDAITGTPGSIFDFWSTSNTTDMAMDLIPISSSALLFGHTRLIARPLTQVCYQVVSWDGTNIPQTVSSDKTVCVEGSFGSPETSAVTWNNGQIAWFWSDAVNGSSFQMQQSFGQVDLNDQVQPPIAPPVSPPVDVLVTPLAPSVVTPLSPDNTPADGLVTPSSPNDIMALAVGVSVGGAVLIAGAVVLAVLLRRKKLKKSMQMQELKSTDSTLQDFDEGKYISLPTALANIEFTIPREKIQLKEQIAAGSFGAVYSAMYNNTPVAVKVHQSDMLSLDDFIHESQLALSIKAHPNVLLTLGITQLNSKTIGLVMEYCAGGSLWSQINDHPPHSKQHVLDMLVSIASGLEHLHANGIIHRDVAARNVLITAEGHLKLADFGMSRKLKEGDGSKTNQTIGPAASMAPESIRDGLYSKKSDVWMFGIMIYEILSGKKPHGSAENLVSVAIDIRETGRIPRLDDHVDEFFKQLMLKCCQFEPEQRPDFEQIIQELNEERQRMNEQS